MSVRFVISDVDGTLVNAAKKLTQPTIDAVARLQAAGVPFTIISARPPSGIAFLVAVPLFAAGLLSHSPALAFALFLIPQALSYMWLAPVLTAVQHLVPAPVRATASASFLLINNLIGLGLGALTIGKISDVLKPDFGDEALRMGMLAALGCYVVAGLLMLIVAPRLARDWVD